MGVAGSGARRVRGVVMHAADDARGGGEGFFRVLGTDPASARAWCSLERTQERMMKSFSRPWNASTLLTSTCAPNPQSAPAPRLYSPQILNGSLIRVSRFSGVRIADSDPSQLNTQQSLEQLMSNPAHHQQTTDTPLQHQEMTRDRERGDGLVGDR
jgi:hypothetical protein